MEPPGWIGGRAVSRLVVTLAVDNAAAGKAIGIKEAIAMDLEKYGDVKVLRVEVREDEQMSLERR